MTKSVKKLWLEAEKNPEFRTALNQAGEHNFPHHSSEEKEKILYTAIYMGWLLGQGLYSKKNYQ